MITITTSIVILISFLEVLIFIKARESSKFLFNCSLNTLIAGAQLRLLVKDHTFVITIVSKIFIASTANVGCSLKDNYFAAYIRSKIFVKPNAVKRRPKTFQLYHWDNFSSLKLLIKTLVSTVVIYAFYPHHYDVNICIIFRYILNFRSFYCYLRNDYQLFFSSSSFCEFIGSQIKPYIVCKLSNQCNSLWI